MFKPGLHNDPINDMYNPLLDRWEPIRKQVRRGAEVFFGIAALSLVNSYFIFTGVHLRFLAGLGITQVVDAFGSILANNIGVGGYGYGIAIAINLLPASVFGACGFFARKYSTWSFIIGMVLYAIDGLLLGFFRDFWGMGFHLFLLYLLYKGFSANRTLKRHTENHQHLTREETREMA